MAQDPDIPLEILTEVMELQSEVSRRAQLVQRDLEKHLGRHLVCRQGCHDCCVDDLTVFPVEAELIRRHNEPLLSFSQPHPPGKCAFLDGDGACRIYPWRPYVCRTQGLPLRWQDVDGEDNLIELRDICPLNQDEIEKADQNLDHLSENMCWTLGQAESRLAGLQVQALGRFSEQLPRISLRDLFQPQPE